MIAQLQQNGLQSTFLRLVDMGASDGAHGKQPRYQHPIYLSAWEKEFQRLKRRPELFQPVPVTTASAVWTEQHETRTDEH